MGKNEEMVLYAIYMVIEKNDGRRASDFFDCLNISRPMILEARQWLLDNQYCELYGNLSRPTSKGFDYVEKNKLWDKFCDLF